MKKPLRPKTGAIFPRTIERVTSTLIQSSRRKYAIKLQIYWESVGGIWRKTLGTDETIITHEIKQTNHAWHKHFQWLRK